MNDLAFTQGQDNLAGTVDAMWVVAHSEIDQASLPALAAASSLRITANIVLLATRKFGVLYITEQTGKLEIKSVGEIDGKSLECMLSGKYPKLDTAAYDWMRGVQNGPLLVIFRMANTGKRFVMGLSQLDLASTATSLFPPVYLDSVEANTGQKRGDTSGATFNFKWSSTHGPVEYTGAIDLTP